MVIQNPIPRDVIKNPIPGSPSISAFNTRVGSQSTPAYREIMNVTDSSLAGLASPSSGQERLLQQQPRYETSQQAAEIYGYEDAPSRGPITSLFDFLGRGQSAVTGALTGALGMQREGDQYYGRGGGEAMRRFGQGFSGQEKYRFAEFTDTGRRVERGEDVGLLARGWNSSLGFVIDTVADPITYVSFGGSIMGRMRAANVVRGKSQNVLREAVANQSFDTTMFMNEALRRNVTRTDKLAFDLNRAAKRIAEANPSQADALKKVTFDQLSSLDEMLQLSSRVFSETGFDLMREVSLDYLPDAAAMAYARRSAAGLRRWSNKYLGKDAGKDYFDSLPRDIQGGLRIRVPFSRNADGVPLSFGVAGTGAGRLGDKFPAIRKVENLTQSGRDIARELFEKPLSLFSGASGDLYYDAVINATGRKVFTSKGKSATTWVDYSGAQFSAASRRALRTTFDEVFLREHEVASALHKGSLEKFGDAYTQNFRRFMYNTEQLNALSESRRFSSDAEEAAFSVAFSWRKMLDEIGQDAVEVFGDADKAFSFLANYVPRVTTRQERTLRFLASKGINLPGANPQYTKHRGQWAAQWSIDSDGRARVLRWMPNEDIMRLRAGSLQEVYESDPTIWMSIYLAEVRSSLNDQKVINLLRDEGLLTRAEIRRISSIDEAELQRRVVQLVDPESVGGDDVIKLKRIQQRLQSDLNYLDPDDRNVGAAMALFLRRSGLQVDGADIVTPGMYNEYVLLDGIYRNIIDGTGIQQVKNKRWVVVDSKGNAIRTNEQFTEAGIGLIDPNLPKGSVREYDTFESAQAAWDFAQTANRESLYYDQYLMQVKQQLTDEIEQIFASDMFKDVHLRSLATMSDDQKTAYIEAWMNALRRFGLDEPELVTTRGGQPAFAKGEGTQPIVRDIEQVSDQFQTWLSGRDYSNISGVSFGPDSMVLDNTAREQIKQRISQDLANDYAPAKLMQNIRRMYKVTQSPQDVGASIYQDFYKPLYAAQKAWMTLGRGPGFVIRNIMGGSWNNWINEVGRDQTLQSARMLAARRVAKTEIENYLQRQTVVINPTEVGEMYRKSTGKYLSQFYDTPTVDEILDSWDMFSRQGLAGNRDSARLRGELLSAGGRTGGASDRGTGIRIREGVGDPNQSLQITLDSDVTWAERALEVAAGDNWWIRDVMSPMVEMSEDYMRFAAFLKGVKEIGVEPEQWGIRGFAASQWVKATQFDYADLSSAEQAIKMIVPFYTWTRYNVPLQVRATIQQPSRVAQALRAHESLGAMFGEEETGISPSYVADRFGITIGQYSPFFEMLPEWMRPGGDVTLGLTWGEPLSDLNQLFRDPVYAARFGLRGLAAGGFLNWRELANQLNPIIAATSSAQSAMAESGRMDGRNVEVAPRWARALGLAQEDPTEPGTYVANRSQLEAIRNLVPLAGQMERLIPYLGGERAPGRWTTSVVSSLFGLPVNTVDDWIKASEMDRRTNFIQRQMKQEFGPEWQYRNEMIRILREEGATEDFVAALNLKDLPTEQVDVQRAVSTWRMMRRMELLIEAGVPEDELIAALSVFVPEGAKLESLVQLIWDYVPKPSTDFKTGKRQFGLQPVSRKDLQALGLTVQDVQRMSQEEQRNLVYWVNRNKGWTGPTK